MVRLLNGNKIPAKVLFVISCVSFCSNWHFGYQITYINTASDEFFRLASRIYSNQVLQSGGDEEMPFDDWSPLWSLIVASFYAGTLIGFLMVPFLVQRVGGVRKSLLYSSFPAVVGCLVQLFVRMAKTEFMFASILSFGRLLIGVQAGCSLCLLPPFIIEQVFQALSTLVGFFVGSNFVTSFGGWKIESLQLVGVLPTLFFIVLLICLPETPFRLLERCQEWGEDTGNQTPTTTDYEWEFERSAIFYYGREVNFDSVREEAFERWSTGDSQESDRIITRTNLKGLIIGSFAGVSFAFSADDLIDSYSTDVLMRSSHTGIQTARLITIGFGVLLFLASVVGAFLIDRFGRKRLLISGLVGTAIGNSVAAFGTKFQSASMITAGFTTTKLFIGFGSGAPAWFLTSELVSPNVVCTAQAISTGTLLVATGLSTLSFLSLEVWVGSTLALLLLSSIPAILLAVFLTVMLPETKDQSFDEIRDCLRRHRFPGIPRISESLSAGGSLRLISPRIEINGGHQRRRSLRMCRAQRLMSASSYASYGSFRSIRTNSHQGRGDYGSVRSLRANSFMSNGTVNDGGSGGSAVCFNVLRPQHDDDASGSHLAAAPERQRRRSKRLSVNDEMLFNNKR